MKQVVTNPDYDHPYNTSAIHRKAAQKMLECFKQYTEWVLSRVTDFCKQHKAKHPPPEKEPQVASQALKKLFLETVSDSNRPFVSALISTQQFSMYFQI